jgi:para-nitrobenzyl esterase
VAVDDLLEAQGQRGALSTVVDGDTLPDQPVDAVRQGVVSDVPLMIGTARDEQKLYVAGRPGTDRRRRARTPGAGLSAPACRRPGAEVIAVYRSSRAARGLPATNHDIVDAVATASRFRMPGLRLAEAQRAHQPKTFVYQFDWESPARGGTLGACHGLEIPFVFGTIGRTGDDRMSGSGGHRPLSGQMMDAWIAFARTATPPRRHRVVAGLRRRRPPHHGVRPRDRRPGGAVRGGAGPLGVDDRHPTPDRSSPCSTRSGPSSRRTSSSPGASMAPIASRSG